MKKTTLRMIGNAHLDPVWLWQWQEGFQEAKATFRSALDRMNEFPEFIFTSSSAAIYEWVEHNDPEMFAEIKARITEGRWQLCGGWWIQPDCNLPAGESFVRQGLYGQRYFKEKFGVTAKVGYNVDSFGHHAMLPQILSKSGMDAYVMMRPKPHEMGLPGRLFWWEADDGSRVLTYRIPYEYTSTGRDLEKFIRLAAAEIKAPFTEMMSFYGVGNHGGGPTKENLESIRRLNEDPNLPALVMSGPNEYFAGARTAELPIPVVHTELQHHASGCYAAHSGVKRWNRRAENLLLAAEKWSAIAHWLTGQPYPTDFAPAWKAVLFNQFHDIMAGTSIEPAYEDARDSYGEALAIAARALNYATQAISWRINIPQQEKMTPVVVFNPHAWPTKSNVELEWGRLPAANKLLDDQDAEIPWQVVQSKAAARWRNRLSFVADLPPLGYRVYRMMAAPTPAPESVLIAPGDETAEYPASDSTIENGWHLLEIDAQTGFIRRLFDKKLNLEILHGYGAVPIVIDDPSDTWSHDVLRFDKIIGEFKATSVKLVAHGPVKSTLRVISRYEASQLVQEFTIYRETPGVEVKVMVDWNERFKMLKLQFPLNFNMVKATYEIPFGHIERPVNGEEEPGQSWLDVSGIVRGSEELYGLSLLNDAKYSFDVYNTTLSMTVLRSPIYAHHDPFVPDPDTQYAFIDQGVQHFTYTLLPHSGTWEHAGTVYRAAELNQPPTAIIETYHEHGGLPQSATFASADKDNIAVSALKLAEDNDDLILRVYETAKIATNATISLPQWQREITTDFAPCEIKTFRIPKDPAQPIIETNLLEWPE